MGRSGLAALAALLLAGCSSESESIPASSPEEQIAIDVNAMFDAWTEGDGEEACSYLSGRGERRLVRIASHLAGNDSAATCEEAVAVSAAATDERFGQRALVEIVAIEGRRARVASEFRGEMRLRRVQDRWLIDWPLFFD